MLKRHLNLDYSYFGGWAGHESRFEVVKPQLDQPSLQLTGEALRQFGGLHGAVLFM